MKEHSRLPIRTQDHSLGNLLGRLSRASSHGRYRGGGGGRAGRGILVFGAIRHGATGEMRLIGLKQDSRVQRKVESGRGKEVR